MEMPIMIGEVVVRVEAAVGFALSEPGESDVSALFHRADVDMYRVKRLGKAETLSATPLPAPLKAPRMGSSPDPVGQFGRPSITNT
jgi:GGDEF domain-containing protein